MKTVQKLHFSLYLPETDWQLLRQYKPEGVSSLSAYLTKLLRSEVARIESDIAERHKWAVLSFVRNGCRSVEDIRYECQSLTPTEIEAMLFNFEGQGLVTKEDGKRGRTWMWTITPEGENKLQERGLFT